MPDAKINRAGLPPSLWATGIGHVVINLPLCLAILYAASEIRLLWLVSAPMPMPPLLAAFFMSVTSSWDEFTIAFLLTRFNVSLPVEIWSMMRSVLTPKTNAVGSLVFLVSIALLLIKEFTVFRKAKR